MTDQGDALADTPEQEWRRILEMPAGAGLDAEVHQMLGLEVGPVVNRIGPDFGRPAGMPRYSTDMAAAWTTVEHLNSTYSYAIWYTSSLSSLQQYPIVAFTWRVHPPCAHDLHGGVAASGETVPLAICRAALLAALAEAGQP